MSEEPQVSKETVVENDTKSTESNDNSELIAESKKYRHRSQAAEAKVAELEAEIKGFADDKLKEKEEFKTLYEKTLAENEQNKALADKWNNFEATKREELLSKLPEDEKGVWEKADLNLLDKYVLKINTNNSNPDHVNNQGRNKAPENGGFDSKTEWITKDPNGYREARKKGLLNYFGKS